MGVWLFLCWYRGPDRAAKQPSTVAAAPELIGLLRDPWARRFYGVFFVSSLASAIPAVLVLFYIRDRLEAEQSTGLFLVIYFLSGALFLPVWQRIASAYRKGEGLGDQHGAGGGDFFMGIHAIRG